MTLRDNPGVERTDCAVGPVRPAPNVNLARRTYDRRPSGIAKSDRKVDAGRPEINYWKQSDHLLFKERPGVGMDHHTISLGKGRDSALDPREASYDSMTKSVRAPLQRGSNSIVNCTPGSSAGLNCNRVRAAIVALRSGKSGRLRSFPHHNLR